MKPTLSISIVTTSLNHDRYLAETLDSVASQSYPALEHLVIDGGSTDTTLDLLRSRAHQPHLHWTSGSDGGQTQAMNSGLRAATGDVIGWLNSDDRYRAGALAAIARAFAADPTLDVLYGDYTFIDEHGTHIRTRRETAFSRLVLFHNRICYIPTTATFFRRRIFDDGHFLDENFQHAMDHEFYMRLVRAGYRFQHLPSVLADFRLHPTSKTCTLAYKQFRETRIARDRHAPAAQIRNRMLRSACLASLNAAAIARRYSEKLVRGYYFSDTFPTSETTATTTAPPNNGTHVLIAALSSATAPSGVCRHAVNLALGLATHPSIDRVTLAVGAWQYSYFRDALRLSHPRVTLLAIDTPNTALCRNLFFLRTLPRLAQSVHASIIHLAYPAPIVRSVAPIAVTLHDLYPVDCPRNFGRLRSLFNRAALSLCLRNADAITCVSAATRDRLFALYPAVQTRASLIPNSVAMPAFPSSLPEMVRSAPFILCVAQHRANKNLTQLLHAFRLAVDRALIPPDTKLVLVGNAGPETPRIESCVRTLDLHDRVLFLRNLSDVALAALYRNCAVLVAPSLVEGFGLPVAEAATFGSRIACSDIPAFRAIAPAHAIFFAPQALPRTLAEALAAAIATPQPSASTPAFTPGQAGVLYASLYASLLQSKRAVHSSTGHHTIAASSKTAAGDL